MKVRRSLLLALSIAWGAEASSPHVFKRQRVKKAADSCSPLELVIARGTGEPSDPTYGFIVGDPLFNATIDLVPGLTAYAVNYPANLDCDSRQLGIQDVLAHLESQSSLCANQKFVLVGYSQGADVIRAASQQIPQSLYNSIAGIVQFGDPGNRGPGAFDPLGGIVPGPFPFLLQGRVRENCAFGDPICTANGTDVSAHISYNSPGTTFIANSAAYIERQFETGGEAGPDSSEDAVSGTETLANLAALQSFAALLGQPDATAVSACPVSDTVFPMTMTATTATTTRALPLFAPPLVAQKQFPWQRRGADAASGSYASGYMGPSSIASSPGSWYSSYATSAPASSPASKASGTASGSGGSGGSWASGGGYGMATATVTTTVTGPQGATITVTATATVGGAGSVTGSAAGSASGSMRASGSGVGASSSVAAAATGSAAGASGSSYASGSGAGASGSSYASGSGYASGAGGSSGTAGASTSVSYQTYPTGVVGGATSTPNAANRRMKIGFW